MWPCNYFSPQSVLILFLALILFGCSDGRTDNIQKFDPLVHTWPHELVKLEPDPSIRYGILENGMRYAITQNTLPEKEIAIRYWIKAGARHEQDDELGVAHFLEHMAFNGSQNIEEGDLKKSLERLGLTFGADSNASTSFSRTIYKLNLPENDDETVDYALKVLREISDRLLIDVEAVDRERGVVLAEENRSDNAFRAAQRATNEFIYENALQIRRPTIGTPESLELISAEMLRSFYESYYRPERAFLVIAGDIALDEMEQKITDTFSDWNPVGNQPIEPDLSAEMLRARPTEARVYNDPQINDTLLMFSSTDSTSALPTEANAKKRFHETVATSIVNRRLSKKILKPDSNVRSAGISYHIRRQGDQRIARGRPKDKDWNAVINLLQAEIKTALEYGFQETEYNEIVADVRRVVRDAANNIDNRKSFQIADGILSNFTNGRVHLSPNKELEIVDATITETTVADIDDAFRRMFSDFEPLIWLQGKGYEEFSNDDVITAFEEANSLKTQKPEIREKKEFSHTDFGPEGKIKERIYRADFEVESLVFENNVRLNLKKTDFKKDWINVSIRVGEGAYKIPDDDIEVRNLAKAFSVGGFEAHPISELSEIFAGRKINTGMGVGEDHLSFGSVLNPIDLRTQLQVWAALLTHPGYREEWKTKHDESIDSFFQTKDSTPAGVARQYLSKIWANGAEREGTLPIERYKSVQLEDFKKYFAVELEKGAIEIGIVGDFERDKVISDVANTFGALKERRPSFLVNEKDFYRAFPKPSREVLFHNGKDNQGSMYIAWPISGDYDWNLYNRYEFVRRILKNRLNEKVREELGVSYAPSAGMHYVEFYSGYGYFSVSVTCDPKYFDTFEKASKEIVADIRKGTITTDEIERVRQPALEGVERKLKENGYWIGKVSRAQSRPIELDRIPLTQEFLNSITSKELNALVKDLFDPKSAHVVTIRSRGQD